MEQLYVLIGWMVVLAFAITFVVTILGLVGRVKIKPTYMKPLFAKLILEVIAAAFFLFYQGLELQKASLRKITSSPAVVYAFNEYGLPVDLKIFQGDSVALEFPKLPPLAFKHVVREARVEDRILYVTAGAETAKTYMGFVEDASHKLGPELLTSDMALALGLHLSELVDKENGTRRDPDEATKYLTFVLDSTKCETDVGNIRQAVKQLYYLQDRLDLGALQLLIESIETYRIPEHIKYLELGEANLKFGDKFEAFKNYLMFLSQPVTTADPSLRGLVATAKTRLTELIEDPAFRPAYVQTHGDSLLADIEQHDRKALRLHSLNMFAPDVAIKN